MSTELPLSLGARFCVVGRAGRFSELLWVRPRNSTPSTSALHGYYYGVFIHFQQGQLGIVQDGGGLASFCQVLLSFSKYILVNILYGNYFRETIMAIMMLILIIGLLYEISWIKVLRKHCLEKPGQELNTWSGPWAKLGVVSMALWAPWTTRQGF